MDNEENCCNSGCYNAEELICFSQVLVPLGFCSLLALSDTWQVVSISSSSHKLMESPCRPDSWNMEDQVSDLRTESFRVR